VFGLFPYIAAFLVARGEERAIIAGLVIAGFGIGGIIYSFAVSALLGRYGEQRMMLGGGVTLAAALLIIALGLPWPVECLAFTVLGLGFYSLHGVIQIYSTELAPQAGARPCDVAPLVLLLSRPGARTDRLSLWPRQHRARRDERDFRARDAARGNHVRALSAARATGRSRDLIAAAARRERDFAATFCAFHATCG
jgi:hypothetical protein